MFKKFLKTLGYHHMFLYTLVLVIFLTIIRYNRGIIQQDNYLEYSHDFPNRLNLLSASDSRLFPGLPILIFGVGSISKNFTLSGYLAVIFSFVGCYALLFKLTGSKSSVIPLIFPPIMLTQATLISTEYLSLFLILLTLLFLKNENFSASFLVAGVSLWVRATNIVLFPSLFFYLWKSGSGKKMLSYIPYYLLPIVILFIFNTHFFGAKNIFYQITAYSESSPWGNEIGFIQLAKDIVRTIQWKQYRILLSGIFYLFLFCPLVILTLKAFQHKATLWEKSVLLFISLTIFFVFSWTFIPFLENLGRYLFPVYPLCWLIIYKFFRKVNLKKLLALLIFSTLVVVV